MLGYQLSFLCYLLLMGGGEKEEGRGPLNGWMDGWTDGIDEVY